MASSLRKDKIADALRELHHALINTQDYGEFPHILTSVINTLFPVDWMGLYTFGLPQNSYNVATNPGLPFDWNEKYIEVMEHDPVREKSLRQPVGGACIFSPKDFYSSEEAVYCYETSKKYTDTTQFLTLHCARTSAIDSGIAFYRTDEKFAFEESDRQTLEYLSPFLVSLSHTMMLYAEFDLKRAALETVCKSSKDLYLCLDGALNIIDLPQETGAFLRRCFKHSAWRILPEDILIWLKSAVAPRGAIPPGAGPWTTVCVLPDLELTMTAHAVVTEQQRTVLVLLLKPHDRKEDFAVLAKDGLSPREQEVLSYLPLGYSNLQIAQAMNIAEVTVKKHLKNASRKLGACGRTETLFNAMRRKSLLESASVF